MRKSILLLLVIAGMAPAAGCAKRTAGSDEIATVTEAGRLPRQQAGMFVGQLCKVQFRRDALGMANPAPLIADADSTGGRAVQLTGIVHSVSDGWVVLVAADGTSYMIPQGSILLLQKLPTQPTQALPRPR